MVGWLAARQRYAWRTLQLLAELALLIAELAVVALQVGAVLQQAGSGALGVPQRRLRHLELTQRAAELAQVGLALAAGGPAGGSRERKDGSIKDERCTTRCPSSRPASAVSERHGTTCPPEPLGVCLSSALPVLGRLQAALQLQHLLLQTGRCLCGPLALHFRRRLPLIHLFQEGLGTGGTPLYDPVQRGQNTQ